MASSGLMANAGGAGQDSLWEDNWDDDDIEDDFSKQLEQPQ
jgi:26 proteasome complex subunit DSS1